MALLVVSQFVSSQAAAISALVPVALATGVRPCSLVAFGAAASAPPPAATRPRQPSPSRAAGH